MANRQVVVVGMGRVGRLLIRALPDGWRVTVIDFDAAKLGKVPEYHHGRPVVKLQGDATSRLVLEDAELAPQTVLVIVTGNDAANREVARLGREVFGVEELVCLSDDTAGIGSVGLAHREVVQRFKAIALIVHNRLTGVESRGIAVGLGEGEIREVTVHEGSGVAGRTLHDIQPSDWLVAAVYRDDRLLVPNPHTLIQVGDRVLLVGEPEVLEKVVRMVRGGDPVFPTQYGGAIAMLGGHEQEANWLAENTQADRLVAVSLDRLQRAPHDSAVPGLGVDGIGCLVTTPEPVPLLARIGLRRSGRLNMLSASRVPFIVARGTHPYRRILVAVTDSPHSHTIASVAIDLTRQIDASLTVLTVIPPTLDEREEEATRLKDVPARIASLARVQGVHLERRLGEGNPIEVIRKTAQEFDLLVVGHSPGRRNTLVTPDISLFLLHDTPCSTLFVPDNVVRR